MLGGDADLFCRRHTNRGRIGPFLRRSLIAFVAAGVTVSLVGIVYGVIMMIKGSVPVGLFEIGLGVTVGAVVLFVGILVYNFAVRLIPFAMKMLAKLLGFAFTKTKEGLRYIKKLIARAERQ